MTSLDSVSYKSNAITLMCCCTVGLFGVHRFYVGKHMSGIIQLLIFLNFGVFGFVQIHPYAGFLIMIGMIAWVLVDLYQILHEQFTDYLPAPIYWQSGQQIPAFMEDSREFSITALLLINPMGIFGAHNFYHQKYFIAVIQMFTMNLFGLWWAIDICLLLSNRFKGKDKKFLTFCVKPSKPPVTTETTIVGLGTRCLAYGVDGTVLGIFSTVLTGILYFIIIVSSTPVLAILTNDLSVSIITLILFLFAFFGFITYVLHIYCRATCWSSQYAATPGMILLGLQIVNKNGVPISVTRGVIRAVVFDLTAVVTWIFVCCTSMRRGLHDYAGGSFVVYVQEQNSGEQPKTVNSLSNTV